MLKPEKASLVAAGRDAIWSLMLGIWVFYMRVRFERREIVFVRKSSIEKQ
jgi:hypothetical protein